jgi:hypothetical protein
MIKKQKISIIFLLFFHGCSTLLKAQSWEAGIELGAGFVAPSSFDSQDGLRTVFFSPGIFVKHQLAKNWWIQANATATRFDYYKNGTTYEEADTYLAMVGVGRSFASDRLSAEVGFGLLHWNYFLNNTKSTDFSIIPTLVYQITNPKKTKINAALFVRYPIGFEEEGAYGWFSAGTRIGLHWPMKK